MSATNVAHAGKRGNICVGNNVSVTMCPRLPGPLDFVQKHFVSATNVSQFAQPRKHHGQQCVRNTVSSFTRAFSAQVVVAML